MMIKFVMEKHFVNCKAQHRCQFVTILNDVLRMPG